MLGFLLADQALTEDPTARLLSEWGGDGSVLVGVGLLAVLYFAAALRWRPRGEPPVSPWRKAWLVLGGLAIVAALYSPLHELSERYLFSAHMLQHQLLVLIAPVLILLSIPWWMVDEVLSIRRVRQVMQVLTFPPVAYVLFNGTIAAAHAPAFYDLSLRDPFFHHLQHAAFIGTAFLAWWPVLSPSRLLPRLPEPGQVLYLFLFTFPSLFLGVLLTDTSYPLYPTYAAAPRLWGMSVLEDQVAGGLMMWVGGSLFYMGVLTAVFFRWALREDRKEQRSYPSGRGSVVQ